MSWGLFRQNISINQILESGYTLCWAAKWIGERKMMFASRHKQGKAKMVREIYDLVTEADVVVHYNGRQFDMPILNQEFLLEGLSPPSPVIQIDLWQVVKQRFRFTSTKLDYVAQRLGLGNKMHHKGMDLWRGCMAGNNADWRIMEKYNRQDVHLLERLYDKLRPWVPNHPNHGLFTAGEERVCPNCGSTSLQSRGTYHTSTMSYQRFRCNGCGSWSKDRHNNLLPEIRNRIIKGT